MSLWTVPIFIQWVWVAQTYTTNSIRWLLFKWNNFQFQDDMMIIFCETKVNFVLTQYWTEITHSKFDNFITNPDVLNCILNYRALPCLSWSYRTFVVRKTAVSISLLRNSSHLKLLLVLETLISTPDEWNYLNIYN